MHASCPLDKRKREKIGIATITWLKHIKYAYPNCNAIEYVSKAIPSLPDTYSVAEAPDTAQRQ